MKKLILVAIMTAFVASLAQAQTNQVLSRNAVGYVKLNAEKGKLLLGRTDFIPMNGSYVASNIFGTAQWPNGTRVLFYDTSLPGYRTDSKSFAGWSTNITFTRGKGFWFQVPTTAPSNNYDIFLMGEVPDSTTAPNTTNVVASGITQIGYPYPADVLWTNTTLARGSPNGTILYTWDGTNYIPNNKSFAGWANPNLVLTPGQGFWYRTANAATNWVEVKPYTWP